MVSAIVGELLCCEPIDQGAMAIEAEAEPAGFSREIGEGRQNTEAIGVGQGVHGAGGEGGAGCGPMALPAETPPGLELAADGFGEGGKGGRGLGLRSAVRGGA